MPKKIQQTAFVKTHWKHKLSYGGELRKSHHGRGARPLSSKRSLHLVFKINKTALRRGLRHPESYKVVNEVIAKYRRKFFVKIESLSVQGDHIHLMVRCSKRSLFQAFFKVVSGQIAQRLTGTFRESYEGPRVWKYRPFSRVVEGFRAAIVLRNYIQLNECEARGERSYRKQRLKGMGPAQLAELWA